ncbi:MAG: YraN family protein [Ignavibacteria bacterium]
MKQQSTTSSGDEGEAIAVRFLRERGLVILETKYRYKKMGEIDIVAKDGDVLVFCEVKMRRSNEFGDPEFAITPKKQANVRRVAHAYLYEHDIDEQECRFDVVAIKNFGGRLEINYIPSAF